MAKELIQGYEADIYQAVWMRPMTWGAPRMWSSGWVVLCLYVGMVGLFLFGLRGVIAPIGVWLIGQGVLIALTQWDSDWDQIWHAHLTRRYKHYCEAG